VVRQKRELAAMLGVEDGAVRVVAPIPAAISERRTASPEFALVGGRRGASGAR